MTNKFNCLGLAKKANAVYIGQDIVLRALKNACEMYVLVSNDISQTLLRKIQAKALKGKVSIIYTDLSRSEIGSLLGMRSSCIVAIEKHNAFAEKIKEINA